MEKAVIILTCYNRKMKTLACIDSIVKTNKNLNLRFVIVDDNSTDGTKEAVLEKVLDAHVLTGNGSLFWNGGMHMGMEYALKELTDADYYVLINDDVEVMIVAADIAKVAPSTTYPVNASAPYFFNE